MARYRTEWSNAAERELLDIYAYIAENGNPLNAMRFTDRIEKRCQQLAEHPLSGRARDDIRPGLRSMPFESVIILYTVEGNAVVISNIVYGGRDYQALLRGERD